MKQIKFFFGFFAFTLMALSSVNAQRAMELTFKKYKNNTNVTSLSYDKKIMDYIKNKGQSYKTKIDMVEILVFKPEQNFDKNELAKINASLSADAYELLINMKTKGKTSKIYSQSAGETVKSVYATMSTDEGNIHFLLKGDIYLNELSKMGLDFEGSEILKFID